MSDVNVTNNGGTVNFNGGASVGDDAAGYDVASVLHLQGSFLVEVGGLPEQRWYDVIPDGIALEYELLEHVKNRGKFVLQEYGNGYFAYHSVERFGVPTEADPNDPNETDEHTPVVEVVASSLGQNGDGQPIWSAQGFERHVYYRYVDPLS